ncbi:LapA family protein [Amantichitinum ursilacus]|uniref:Lipopolysaccharide assembly protein A domain-containing protein n=1 Tax=Amantichitinum ursilacus TaxID=857265 RepID=A0A0N0XID7_9NEIS|nr:lipopolysaccharide assembly protein LapA domain-containing protein [Amantichitinum ursilacus]KPC52739.1 hypothetical protein WG78_12865 [Amantichitinum ursilacus]
MRYVYGLIKLLVFIVLLGFAMHNADTVSLQFFLGYSWEAPLSMILFVFFAAGAVFAFLAMLGQVFRLRREVVALRKELRVRTPAPVEVVSEPLMVEQPRDAL